MKTLLSGEPVRNSGKDAADSRGFYPGLLLSALFGFVMTLGNGHAVWQVPVETGQVLAGLVEYPPNNPFYLYHIKVWTLLNQAAALLLSMGISEISASV